MGIHKVVTIRCDMCNVQLIEDVVHVQFDQYNNTEHRFYCNDAKCAGEGMFDIVTDLKFPLTLIVEHTNVRDAINEYGND